MKAWLVASSCILHSSTASAQGFALSRFDPSERGSDWFTGESLDLRGHARIAAGLVGDWAHKPLVVRNADGTERSAIVQDQNFLRAGASMVLWERVRFGVDAPLALHASGSGGQLQGTTFRSPDGQSFGDLRLGGDVRVVGKYRDPISVAVGLQTFIPTGSPNAFTGDGTFRLQPRVLAAGRYGLFVYSGRIAFQYRPNEDAFAGSPRGSEFLFGASAGMLLASNKLIVGPELYGGTVVSGDEGPLKSRNTPMEALLGAHYLVTDDWKVGLGGGPGLTQGDGSPLARIVASVEWAPGVAPSDRDSDGIVDTQDACPTVPGIKTDDPRTNGCPPPPRDDDGDGVVNPQDACPTVPGVKTNDPQTNGCPIDHDKDGIVDTEDACPTVPGPKTSDPQTNGCPPDRDKDMVPDTEDACPDVPGIKTNDPRTNGCPGDRDKDNIRDDLDACPDEAGPTDPDPKKNGCPKAIVRQGQIKIAEQIKFRQDSHLLDPASDPILGAVFKVLIEHPEIKKLQIQGHTDNHGGAAYNMVLSKNRAASVMKWLVSHGIDQSRLTAEGFGLTRPIADNKTADGRRDNRRVEFHIVDPPPAKE